MKDPRSREGSAGVRLPPQTIDSGQAITWCSGASSGDATMIGGLRPFRLVKSPIQGRRIAASRGYRGPPDDASHHSNQDFPRSSGLRRRRDGLPNQSLAEGLEPHKVREIYLAGAQTPDVAIDITAQIDRKIDSLRAHSSQVGDWEFEPMVREWAKETAARFPDGGEYVESFKYFKLD